MYLVEEETRSRLEKNVKCNVHILQSGSREQTAKASENDWIMQADNITVASERVREVNSFTIEEFQEHIAMLSDLFVG